MSKRTGKKAKLEDRKAAALEVFVPGEAKDDMAEVLLEIVQPHNSLKELLDLPLSKVPEFIEDLRYEADSIPDARAYLIRCIRAEHAFEHLASNMADIEGICSGRLDLAEQKKLYWGRDGKDHTDKDYFDEQMRYVLDYLAMAVDLIAPDSQLLNEEDAAAYRARAQKCWKKMFKDEDDAEPTEPEAAAPPSSAREPEDKP